MICNFKTSVASLVTSLLCECFSQLHDSSSGHMHLFFRGSTQTKPLLQEQRLGLFCVQAVVSVIYDEPLQPD